MDGTSRCCSRSSIISGNQDNLCSGFCNTGCDSTNTCFGYQFNGDSCIHIRVFQVINQLCKVLDGVDVVVRRRDIKVTPGVEWRVLATSGVIFFPGRWPPSPGLAP